MMRITGSNNIVVACIVALLSLCSTCKAEDTTTEYNLNSWMTILSDTMKVCRVSIPGTHDTLTGEGFTDTCFVNDYTTQVATFNEQMEGGIRYFDVRLVMNDINGTTLLQTSHRTATINLTFSDVLSKAKSFLEANPSEFLLIKIQYDGGDMTPADKARWDYAMQQILTDTCYANCFAFFRPDLRVRDMRGKILLISRTAYGTPICGALTNWPDEGTDDYVQADSAAERILTLAPCQEAATAYHGCDNTLATRLYVQDYYNSIGCRMEAKLQAVESMFRSTQQLSDADNVWVINHTSGFSTPKMNAIGYAENASKTNSKLLSLLRAGNVRHGIGIIAMDFACIDTLNQSIGTLGVVTRSVMSRSLTRAIIDTNRK